MEFSDRPVMSLVVLRLLPGALAEKTRSSPLAGTPPGEVVDQLAGLLQLPLAALPTQVVVAGVTRVSNGSRCSGSEKRRRVDRACRFICGNRRDSQRRQEVGFMESSSGW